MKYLLLIIPFWFCLACTKDSQQIPDITGTWVRSDLPPNSEFYDTLHISSANEMKLRGIHFIYRLTLDSIYINYSGDAYIYCSETSHKYEYSASQNTLILENINRLCLVSSDQGSAFFSRID